MYVRKPNAVEKFLGNTGKVFTCRMKVAGVIDDVPKFTHCVSTIFDVFKPARHALVGDEIRLDSESPMVLVEDFEEQHNDFMSSDECVTATVVLCADRRHIQWHSTHVVNNGSTGVELLGHISDLYFTGKLREFPLPKLDYIDITPTGSRLNYLAARAQRSDKLARVGGFSSAGVLVDTPDEVLALYAGFLSGGALGINSCYKYATLKAYRELYSLESASLLCTMLMDPESPFSLLYYLETYDGLGEGFGAYVRQHKAYYKERHNYAQLFTSVLRHNDSRPLGMQYSIVNTIPCKSLTGEIVYTSIPVNPACVAHISRFPQLHHQERVAIELNSSFVRPEDRPRFVELLFHYVSEALRWRP